VMESPGYVNLTCEHGMAMRTEGLNAPSHFAKQNDN